MLRPRFPCTLMRRSHPLLCVHQAQRQPCSTLGDIGAFIASLREKDGLSGGTLQLCFTEDMRVFAEHRVSSCDGQRRVIPLDKAWQGSASTTVAEALQSLQASGAAIAGSALSVSPSVSSSPSSLSSCPRQLFTHHATIVDLTRISVEETRSLILHIENTYPALRLVVRHTSGTDLQGTKLHTLYVELVPRAGQASAASLSGEMRRLVDTFKGESVGEGYNSCLRRALRDAFMAAQLPFPATAKESADAATLMFLYAQTWAKDGFQLCLSRGPPPCDSVECAVRQPSHGLTLATTTLPLTAVGLRDLLRFCDQVAASHNPKQHASIKQRIQSSPLHLILPRSNLRVKHLLRRLLYYHYGIVDTGVTFTVCTKTDGVFTSEVVVRLSPLIVSYDDDDAAQTPLFVLARATGTARRKVMELAAVQAMQTLFPEIFEKQIAYHADIRSIQLSDKASVSVNVPPHVSRGYEAQLKWAVQTINADFVVERVLLKQNTPYPLWGVSTGPSTVWLSQLFILRPAASANAGAAAAAAGTVVAGAPRVVRELCVHAFDKRKSRSEQKVIAAALAKCFSELCVASIKDAEARNLIDSSGAPAPCAEVHAINDSGFESFAEALSVDPCLVTLTPTCSPALQWLPESTTGPSALVFFWTVVARASTQQASLRVQRNGGIAASGGYIATYTTGTGTGSDEVEKIMCEAAASTEIGAVFALLEKTQRLLLEERQQERTASVTEDVKQEDCSAIGSNADGAANANDLVPKRAVEFLVGIPMSLPTSTPLQTCTEAICRLYGLRCAVRMIQEGSQYAGELWGSFPADSDVLKRHDNITSSPFFLDRAFLLGRGHAESPFMAVVRAAQRVFECHVRVHRCAFHDAVVKEGVLHLNPAGGGSLAVLRDAVLSEIQATSDRDVTDHTLELRFSQGQPHLLTFTVSTGRQFIKLEETAGRHVLDCAHDFCTCVSAETGVEFLSPAKLATIVVHTPEQLLRQLCQLAYGFDLRVEMLQVDRVWHCRLSVALTGELACCIAESSSNRKKDAVDAAAASALRRYFADEAARVPSYAALFSFSNSIDAGTVATQTNLEGYVFQVPERSEGTALTTQ